MPSVVGWPLYNRIWDVRYRTASGRCETTPVITLAGSQGGEGKSIFLKPLLHVFRGRAACGSPQKGNFPLLGLEHAKVVLLDEYRLNQSVLPFSAQCLWFDGSSKPDRYCYCGACFAKLVLSRSQTARA